MKFSAHAVLSRRHTLPDGRQLAFSDSGPSDATDVLLCLPGLLETRQTFTPILQSHPEGLRCLSVDYCGRGESDSLAGDLGYSMTRYLADLKDFLAAQVPANARLHLLGTSMGGILAFYLIAQKEPQVHSLLLNDIGLVLEWSSLMDLSRQMQSARQGMDATALAQSLQVTPGVLAAVQLPTHFDLPYRRGLKGMGFAQLLAGYTGPIRLVRGHASRICLPAQVRQLHKLHPDAQVHEVAGAAHPVPFDAAVCAFLLQGLGPDNAAADAPATPGAAANGPGSARSLWRWLQDKFNGR